MAVIRANRESIDDRFSVLGFTVRSELPLFEIAIASDPELLRPELRTKRTPGNFHTSRLLRAAPSQRGEAVYLVPPDVVARFVGQPRLYFGLATYRESDRNTPVSMRMPDRGTMYVSLSGLTERGLRRTVRSRGPATNGSAGYGGNGVELGWGGDAVGSTPPPSRDEDRSNAPRATTISGAGEPATYSDGYSEDLWKPTPSVATAPAPAPVSVPAPSPSASAQSLSARSLSTVDQDSAYDIGGPIPDAGAANASASNAQGWYGTRGLTLTAPEYSMASRFEAANTGNFRAVSGTRTINKIVIHITDGGANINGTISWFKNPDAKVSAHYVIGQDGEIVQMVAHNDVAWHAGSANGTSIGIEHVANTKGLNPTPAQMCASAALVTWLCDQFGITPLRANILGHAEADGKTTHAACPNAVWDWVYYMDMITTRTCYVPESMTPRTQSLGYRNAYGRGLEASEAHDDDPDAYGISEGEAAANPQAAAPEVGNNAQSLGLRRGYSTAQEIITPFYDPADSSTALSCQNNAFSLAREEWFVGVEDTHAFPHSAICQLNMLDSAGRGTGGTGFYIGRNRILTCAHNLHGKTQVTVIPGKNAGSQQAHPFTVGAAAWRIAPGYTGSGHWANDLAVIDNTPVEAPHGQWFEFLNATPGENLPIVVCGYSGASDAVPELTPLIDWNKQHLHGGYAAGQSDPDVIEYAILTLHGASGSPVYHIEKDGDVLRAKVCAVHVTGQPAAQGVNRGCFITPRKIDWIEGRTTSLSLGMSNRADSRALGSDGLSDYPVHLIPQPNKDACWAAAMAMLLAHRRQLLRTPESIVNDVGGSLSSSYGWDLIKAVKARYGFDVIEQPSNASIYHTPRQWAEWLNTYGPLWVVIVGAPHAVVVAGIRGDLGDPSKAEVKILNPWDTRIAFDNNAIDFNPANKGYESWLRFDTFASDFGNMAEANYGNWRVLHLPVSAAHAQALSAPSAPTDAGSKPVDDPSQIRLPPPPPPVVRELSTARALDGGATVAIATTIAGAVMERLANNDGDITWELDQLRGYKHPNDVAPSPMPPTYDAKPIRLKGWPTVEVGFLVTDEISAGFEINWQHNGRSVGNVLISNIATNDAVGMGLVVKAKIMDDNIVYPRSSPTFAALRVRFEYRFTHYVRGDIIAIRDIRLFGDGTYSDDGRWEQG